MKKVRPHTVLMAFIELLMLAFAIFGWAVAIYFVVLNKHEPLITIVVTICGILTGLCCSFAFYSLVIRKIEFKQNYLYVSKDKEDKSKSIIRRLQHEVKIEYQDIEKIALHSTTTDTKNHDLKFVFVSMPHIIIECKDGKKEGINVYFYTRKQVIHIIDEIVKRAIEKGNDLSKYCGQDMVSEFIKQHLIFPI